MRVNGQSMLRFGDKGLYAVCSKGLSVPWWCCEGMTMVRVNGVEASAGDLVTGSIDGPGFVQASTTNVFVGGPVITKMERARKAALARLRRAQAALERWSPTDQARFAKWFGGSSEAERQAMLINLLRMERCLEGSEIRVGERDDAFAHIRGDEQPQPIYVDQEFWRSAEDDGGGSQKDTESGVLIHETSHMHDAASTGDYSYGSDRCETLAKKYPEYAQNNADNIEYFCEETP